MSKRMTLYVPLDIPDHTYLKIRADYERRSMGSLVIEFIRAARVAEIKHRQIQRVTQDPALQWEQPNLLIEKGAK